MSGQLVGEVIAAAYALQKRGLSERGFHALIAIAEKCQTQTRRGSVRWDHIRDGLYGASLSTAKRAVTDLKTVGAIRVLKRGFDNQHGRICAPLYQIEPLADTDIWVSCESASATSERVTQVTQSSTARTIHPDDPIGGGANGSNQVGERVKPGGERVKPGGRTGYPDDPLDGPIDGPIDGESSPTPGTSPPEPQPSTNDSPLICFAEEQDNDTEPPPCPRHPNGTGDNCGACGTARRNHDAWKRRRLDSLNELKAGIRQQIDACNNCDPYGQIDGEHCSRHLNFKQPDIAALMKQRDELNDRARRMKINIDAYADAVMHRDCPNCGAPPNDWCRRADGHIRRPPCIKRIRPAVGVAVFGDSASPLYVAKRQPTKEFTERNAT